MKSTMKMAHSTVSQTINVVRVASSTGSSARTMITSASSVATNMKIEIGVAVLPNDRLAGQPARLIR